MPLAIIHAKRTLQGAAAIAPLAREPVGNGMANAAHERAQFRHRQRTGGTRRMNARAPECLGGVDVPQPGDDALIEKQRLDRSAARFEGAAQRGGGERLWLRAERELRQCVGGVIDDGAERAGIHEREPGATLRFEDDTGVGRQRVAHAPDDPVTVHAEVHGDDCAVVEDEVLMLRAPNNLGDASPDDAADVARRETAPLRRVVRRDHDERLADEHAPGHASSEIDFREFGHRERLDGGREWYSVRACDASNCIVHRES